MIGRKALSNPSIFRKEGILTMEQDIHNFLDKACIFDESYTQTKYVVQRILGSQQVSPSSTVPSIQVLKHLRGFKLKLF